ncbi:MAG: hypothetical protein ACI837_002705 [Crocinitomicaceae bacterium]
MARRLLHQLVANLAPNNKHLVRAVLLAASPYLSRSLLEELGEKSPGQFPHPWYREIIEANIEVTRSDDFMLFLDTKSVPLPNGHQNQLNALRYTTFSERGELEMEIMKLEEDRVQYYNLLIANEHSRDDEINWASIKTLLSERDNEVCRAEVADSDLNSGNSAGCVQILDDIDANLAEYEMPYIKQEMQDYSTFKHYVLGITNNTGIVEELTDPQRDQLIYMRDNFIGRSAVQAGNMLCFHRGTCTELQVVLPTSRNQMAIGQTESEQGLLNLDSEKLSIFPNPTDGNFILEVPEHCSIETLAICDIRGRVVAFEQLEQLNNHMKVHVTDVDTGILILKASCTDGSVYTSRVLLNK